MAKTSKVVREQKLAALAERYQGKREELRKRSIDVNLSLEERMEARAALGLLPRNSAKVRQRKRCKITGRPRGYISRLGVSRVLLRDLAHAGVMPGLTKSSW